jgi:integrase
MLLACLDSAKGNMTWILTEHGKPRSEKAISNWFSEAARDAGLMGYTAHGLRKTRAIALAEAGATHHQIGAWTGHDSLKEIENYTRGARQKLLIMGTSQELKMETRSRAFPKTPKNGAKSKRP